MKIPFPRMFPFKKQGRFLNYIEEQQEGFAGVVRMCTRAIFQRNTGIDELRAGWVTLPGAPHASETASGDDIPRIQWIGHSSFLITIGGFTVITDPIFGSSSWLFPRWTPPGISLDALPHIDAVLISHNHYDHLDIPSIRLIAKRNPLVQIFAPWGDRALLVRSGFSRVTECMWWDDFSLVHDALKQKLELYFLPAVHWSRRALFDRNRSLWGSWIVRVGEQAVYFAGDTASGEHFKAIAHEFPSINTALMPVSPCEPRASMRFVHLSAEDAGEAFLALGAHRFVPMHWGTYHFGEDHPLVPIRRLTAWWEREKEQLLDRQLALLKIGECCVCTPALPQKVEEQQSPLYVRPARESELAP
ncbi:TPA: hypothetical protein DEG75_01560 [Candidatus Dependentiae bacterium]|nr:hypothetical protein [Candidatus Dependentiae bacterium]